MTHIKNGAKLIVVGTSRNKGKIVTVADVCTRVGKKYYNCLLEDGTAIQVRETSLQPISKKKPRQKMFNIDEYCGTKGGILITEGKTSVNTQNCLLAIPLPKQKGK